MAPSAAENQIPAPTGTRPLPIIGNLHQMSRSETWKQLVNLHAQYGPILTLKLGKRTIILLQTRAAVRDLLGRKARIYSSRPRQRERWLDTNRTRRPLNNGDPAPIGTRHPPAQLDLLVGPDRLPIFADAENLPYLHAFINESLRLKAITPLAVPHALSSTAEDEPQIYNGYHIPRDALITLFQWAINRDASVFNDPHTFIPQRWLDANENGDNPLPAPALFGYGKRLCPGQPFAGNALVMALAVLVWGFEGADDEYKFVYDPPIDRIKVRVRSEKLREVIVREWEGSEKGMQGVLDGIGREEGFMIGPERQEQGRFLQGPNQWVGEDVVPGFRGVFMEYFRQVLDYIF
ncbi:cytochrome P450 [Aspergillus spectabilis]